VSVNDATPVPLSAKLLDRPRLLERIGLLIPDRTLSHLVPYNTTELERNVALALGIPMYGADPRFFPLGTKSGCRQLFAVDVTTALVDLRSGRPGVKNALVKLNEGVSGEGNAFVDLEGLPESGAPDERTALAERILLDEADRASRDCLLPAD
jgi:hypothetical protein